MSRRRSRLKLLFPLLIASCTGFTGCSNGSSAPEMAEPEVNGVAKSEGTAVVSRVDLETLPIAADTSLSTIPVPQGNTAGEVQDLSVLKVKFCWCPAATFSMGTPDDSPDRMLNERQVAVTLTSGFWMQQTEVTQAQYLSLMGANPSHFAGDDLPVDSVTWDDAVEFCRRLSELPAEKAAGNVYRLPTEAEWEYACRAGTDSSFSFGSDAKLADEFAWYRLNAEMKTHPVAQKKPNPWNLFDMHGNVWEWCQDFYADYPGDTATDPTGAAEGEKRVLRGGGWYQMAESHRSAFRDAYVPSARYFALGFRIVAVPTTASASQ